MLLAKPLSADDLTEKDRERFWSKVAVAGPDECWPWQGALKKGYGQFHLTRNGQSRKFPAPRVAYTLLVGPIAEDREPDHLCRNRACVNPAHVEIVTRGENALRGRAPSILLHNAGLCKNGHPLTEENTYSYVYNGKPQRQCRQCQVEAARAYRKQYPGRGGRYHHQPPKESQAPNHVTHRTGICRRGHPQTPDNVYVDRNGSRHCKPCRQLAKQRRRAESTDRMGSSSRDML